MPYLQDFLSYHKSIAREISAAKDRIRDLIGDAHWQSDGEHKEAILRRVLRSHLPASVLVGKGFVCFRDGASPQIDLLLIDANKPTLFREGDTFLVTPDAVKAVIEVKTTLRRGMIHGPNSVFEMLGNTVGRIRSEGNGACQAGLFSYSNDRIPSEEVLDGISHSAHGDRNRVTNWAVLSEDRFLRFWEDAPYPYPGVEHNVWHAYNLEEMAYAYFLGNVVFDVGGQVPLDMQYAWFPLPEGKEAHREHFAELSRGRFGRPVRSFRGRAALFDD